MGSIRAYFRHNHAQAFVLVVLALCLKLLVPTGFMIGQQDHGTFTVSICQDATGGAGTYRMVIPMKGDKDPVPGKPAKGECPYAALSMHALGGVDTVLLALAIAFVMALGLAPVRKVHSAPADHLRPPLRGPPA